MTRTATARRRSAPARLLDAATTACLSGRCLVAALAVAMLAICAVFVIVMADARSDARRSAEAFGLDLATALSQDLARNVELLDLSIQSARDSWGEPRVRALPPDLRQLLVFDHSATAQYIDSVFVTAPDGSVAADSLSAVPRATNYAGADFFEAQVARDVGLFVSRPMRIPGKPGWSLAFSRRISDRDGRFGGVAVGIMNLGYLSAVYRGLDVGAGGSLFLFNTGGTMLVREPDDAPSIGRSFANIPAFDKLRSANEGSFEAESSIDGKVRLYNFHRVGDLPLVQTIALSTATVYAEWRHKVIALGCVLGLLCVATSAMFFVLKRELARRVAAQTALGVLAARDHLTGLANRRTFFEAAETRLADPAGMPVSVLMIDADHFKRYNDRYGHLAGDAVLAKLGGCIANEVSAATDVAARFGGEEFVVLLGGAAGERAMLIAEAIRVAVARLAIPHEGTPAGLVTVSIGVASGRTGPGESLSGLVGAADEELYRSKGAGRNRSSLAHPQAPMRPIARSA